MSETLRTTLDRSGAPLPPARKAPESETPRRATAAGPKPRPGKQAKQGKQRDAFFDNAKYLAIVLVAMGHAWVHRWRDPRAPNQAPA